VFPLIRKECQYLGSLWGNYNELREVMELAKKGLIKNNVQKFNLSEVNDALDRYLGLYLGKETFKDGEF
jgi:alcohol dehydrogenase, propanol-preferring